MLRLGVVAALLLLNSICCLAQAVEESAPASGNGEDEMLTIVVAGFHALGYDSTETIERVNAIIARAPNQVLDTMLRSALIAGSWARGLEWYLADTIVHVPAALVSGGVKAVYFMNGDVSEVNSASFVAVVLNKPLPDGFKFALRTKDGTRLGNILGVRTFAVRGDDLSTEYTAYEVMTSIAQFDDERMYLDIAYAGK